MLLLIYNASLNYLICVFLEQLNMPAIRHLKDAGITTCWKRIVLTWPEQWQYWQAKQWRTATRWKHNREL